jgi:hypothetical protein
VVRPADNREVVSPNLTGPIFNSGVSRVGQQKRIQNVVLLIAVMITIALFFIDFFYGAMAVIVLGVLYMSFRIMGETTHFPDVVASLPENARGIILSNRGNDVAMDIHITLVPQNLEFDLPSLEADVTHLFALSQMVEKVKVLITYKSREGGSVSRSFNLSSLDEAHEEADLLKPAFPIFGWK